MAGANPSKPGDGAGGVRRPSHRGRKLLLSLVSVVIGLGLAEIACRLLAPAPLFGMTLEYPQVYFFEYDPVLGWRGRGGAAGAFAGFDFLVDVRLDARGFRSSTKPWVPGKKNILILGDSFAWGWGVEDKEVFSEVMMREDDGRNVYNLSAPGYDPGQQGLLLSNFLDRHPARQFDGCVLVLSLENDFEDITASKILSYPKPVFELVEGRLVLRNVPVPRTGNAEFATAQRLTQSSLIEVGPLNFFHLYNRFVAYPRYIAEAITRAGPVPDAAAPAPPELEEDRRALMAALLSGLRDIAAGRGIPLTMVVIHGNDPGPRLTWLTRFLSEEDISCRTFNRQQIGWRTRTFCLDPHLNAHGHELLAETVTEVLEADGSPGR